MGPFLGPATTQNLVVNFDGEICGGVLVENASDDFPQQKKLENLLPNFAGSSPPISPKTSPTSLWKSLLLTFWLLKLFLYCRRPKFLKAISLFAEQHRLGENCLTSFETFIPRRARDSRKMRKTCAEALSGPLSHLSPNKEGKSAINLSNLGNFCQIWPRAIYLC